MGPFSKVTTVAFIIAVYLGKACGLYCYTCNGEKENWKCNEAEPVRCKPREVCITAGRRRVFKTCREECPISRGDGPSMPCRECSQDLCNSQGSGQYTAESENPRQYSARDANGSKHVLFAKVSTFWEARLRCAGDGGILTTIHSSSKQKFIVENFINNPKATAIMETAPPNATTYPAEDPFGIWIGLRRANGEASNDDIWFWTDDGTIILPRHNPCSETKAPQYQNWDSGHTSVYGAQQCGLLSADHNGRWRSGSCGRLLRGYICEYPDDVRQSIILNGTIYTYNVVANASDELAVNCSNGKVVTKDLMDKLNEAFALVADKYDASRCPDNVLETMTKERERAPRECQTDRSYFICETPLTQDCSSSESTTVVTSGIEVNTAVTSLATESQFSKDNCDKSIIRRGKKVLSFPPTRRQRFSYSQQKCPDGRPYAVMLCGGWPQPTLGNFIQISCNQSQAESLYQALHDAMDGKTPLSKKMREIHAATLFDGQLSQSNLSSIQEALTTLSESASEATQEALSNAVATVSGLRGILVQKIRNRTASAEMIRDAFNLVKSLEIFSKRVEMAPNETRSTFGAAGIEVEIVTFDDGTLSSQEQNELEYSSPDEHSVIRVSPDLPLIRSLPGKKLRAVFTTYDTDDLFPTEEDVQVNSIISATITDGERTYSVPVEFAMRVQTNLNISSDMCVERECRYYDHIQQLWKADGCREKSSTREMDSDVVTCECDHTTSFSVVVSQHAKVSYALDIVSTISLSICIVCLSLTIIIFIFTPELRRVRSALTHTSLCACLVIAYLVFLVGVEATSNRYCCLIVAVLIHFFLLAAWGWMAVESITMYRMFVRTFERRNDRESSLKKALIVYAASAAVVFTTLSFAVLTQYMDWNHETGCEDDVWSSYISEGYCWLHGNSLFFGFLLIIGIVLCFNIVFAGLIVKAITWGRTAVNSSVEEKPIVHVMRAVLVALLLGVAWVFAVPLAVSSDPTVQEVFGWLFAITIFCQGVFVFYFFCLRRKDVRDSWTADLMKACKSCGNESANVTLNATTSAGREPPNSGLNLPNFRRTLTSSTASDITRKTTASRASSFVSPQKEQTTNLDKCVYKPRVQGESKSLEHSLDLVEFTGEEVFGT